MQVEAEKLAVAEQDLIRALPAQDHREAELFRARHQFVVRDRRQAGNRRVVVPVDVRQLGHQPLRRHAQIDLLCLLPEMALHGLDVARLVEARIVAHCGEQAWRRIVSDEGLRHRGDRRGVESAREQHAHRDVAAQPDAHGVDEQLAQRDDELIQ